MTDTLLEAGVARCRRAGLSVAFPDDAGEPPAVARPDGPESSPARPDDDRRPFDPSRTVGRGPPTVATLLAGDRPVAVEALDDPDPTLVLSRLWNDQRHGRAALFVVPDEAAAERTETLLAPPVGVADADSEGRTFHTGPDRIRLAEGGYAAVPAGTRLQWRESTTTREPVGVTVDAPDADAIPDPDAATEGPWLDLVADGEVVVRLDGVDGLRCPSRERFPYAYRRDEDKLIRVVDFAGRPVQRYDGIGAMRDGGFRPVPAPLVPEHMFASAVDGWWATFVADR
jgi:hypothetical protein